MLRQRTRTLQAAVAVTDAAVTAAAFFAAYYLAGRLPEALSLRTVLPLERYLWLLGLSVPMWWVLFALFGCYDFSPIERLRESLRRLSIPLLLGVAIVGAVVFFSKQPLFSRRLIGGFLLTNAALLLAGRALMLKAAPRFYRATGALRRVLVVGPAESAREFAAAVESAGWGLEMAGYVVPEGETAPDSDPDCLGTTADLSQLMDARGIDDVVLAGPCRDLGTVRGVIQTCEEVGACLHIPSSFFNAELSRPHLEVFRGIRMLTFSTAPYNPVALGVKRAGDMIGSLALGAALSVPMLAIAVIVKCTSKGPVIFRQVRSGLYGRPFVMYKFRSMVADAEARRDELDGANEMDGPVFKMQRDPRVTPFGRFIRRYSLDELPQLWNVFRGDMSLIGPRPPLPAEVAKYERWQRRRLSMRPGLTCIWQVTDRNLATFDRWMEYDLRYIDNWSLWMDMKIALQTVPAVLKGTGI